jgi:hypothetical protein
MEMRVVFTNPAPLVPADESRRKLRQPAATQPAASVSALAHSQHCCERRVAGCYRLKISELLARLLLAQRGQLLAISKLGPEPIHQVNATLRRARRVRAGLVMRRRPTL